MKQTLQLNRNKKKSAWTDELLPKYYAKRTCKHCGDIIKFYHNKKFICKNVDILYIMMKKTNLEIE